MNWKFTYLFTLLLSCFCCLSTLSAQTIKHIEVEEGQPYVDHVAMIEGSKDMDLLIKFTFDEPQNSLTVSLISYKKLFVFHDNVRYKKSKSFHTLKPEKLPYVVESDEMVYYKYMKPLRQSIKPKSKHVFKRWIEVEGLQPQPTQYKMVNDFIEQKFDILNKRNQVQVNLQDVLVMNETQKDPKKRYDLFFQKNLNRNYVITIKRNPCFGKEEALQTAKARKTSIEKSYQSLLEAFGPESGPILAEKVPLFEEMKALLQEEYPLIKEKNECSLIQAEINQYNLLVDSIQKMEYSYEKEMMKPVPLNLEPEYILQMARKINHAVNRWQLTTDMLERKDLAMACNAIIDQITSELEKAATMTAPQAEAVEIFKEAKIYYQKNCEDNIEE